MFDRMFWRAVKIIGILFLSICVLLTITGTITAIVQSQKPVVKASAQPPEEITPDGIYNLVNDQRRKAGVSRLSQNPLATKAAKEKCDDMVANDYYEHVNPKTGRHGYQYSVDLIPNGTLFSENLDQGSATSNAAFVQSWLDSPPHRAAMLDSKYTDTGIAVCRIPSEPADSLTAVEEFVQIK